MIPYIKKGALELGHPFLTFLPNCISAVVTENLTGYYGLKIVYPIGAAGWDSFLAGREIYVKPRKMDNDQPFIIRRVKRTAGESVVVEAEHVSSDLANLISGGYDATESDSFIDGLMSNAIGSLFTISCEYTENGEFHGTGKPYRTIKDLLFGKRDSFKTLYGGEAKFDGLSVNIKKARGSLKDFSIDFGVNMTNIVQTSDVRTFPTSVYPYYANSSTLVELPSKVIYTSAEFFSEGYKTEIVNLTSKFSEVPTVEQLEAEALKWISNNVSDGLPDNLKVQFVDVSGRDSSTLDLGDYITVRHPEFNISAQRKVISTTFDPISERYTSIEVGDPIQSLPETLLNLIKGG